MLSYDLWTCIPVDTKKKILTQFKPTGEATP